MPRDLLDDLDAARLQQKFVVAGAEPVRHVTCIFALVVARLIKADGEGLEPLAAHLACQRHYGGRVNATRQKEADRHIGYQPEPHRIPQDRQNLFDDQLLIHQIFARFGRRPIALLVYACAFRLQPAAGPQSAHAAENGAGAHHVRIGEIVIQRNGIEALLDQTRLDQRFQFGGEVERAPVFQHVERFFAETVAGGKNRLAASIVNRESKHAVEPVETFFAPHQVGVQQHFGIGAGV